MLMSVVVLRATCINVGLNVAFREQSGPDEFMSTRASTTLADLFTPLLFADLFSAVRASLWRRSNDEFDDGVAYGRQAWLRWRSVDSFFSVPLWRCGGAARRRKQSSS